jgi:DNA modification methylase
MSEKKRTSTGGQKRTFPATNVRRRPPVQIKNRNKSGPALDVAASPTWPADRVERRPIASLKLSDKNARTHSESQINQLAASMRQWGWTIPVLCDEVGDVIAGHGRILAAGRLGLAEAPVMIATGWSEAQKRAYRLADNQLALNAAWNFDLIGDELKALQGLDFDIGLIGFADIDALLRGSGGGVPDPALDVIPEVPAQQVTLAGDIWQLGRHRLICGDCRDGKTIDRLVAGQRINVAFTSPPYAVQRDYDKSSGFQPVPPDQYVEWFAPVAANVARHLAADGSWFVNIKPSGAGLDTDLYVFDLVLAHARQWGWHFATEFCWERVGVPKRVVQRFKNQFEPVYQFARDRWKMRPDAVRHMSENVPLPAGPGIGETSWANRQGTRQPIFGSQMRKKRKGHPSAEGSQGTHWQSGAPLGVNPDWIAPGLAYPGNRLPTFAGSHEATGHAAAFPVGLPAFFARAYSDEQDLIYDPFCGSGSTIVAAEETKRQGLGCEISPNYCDITVVRYRKLYPDQPVVLLEDGRSYDEMAAARVEQKPKVSAAE